MDRVASIKEGADGIVTATMATGSLFRFRAEDAAWALGFCGAESGNLNVGDELPDGALALAVQVLSAEKHGLELLSRAEQYRRGLWAKLVKAGRPDEAVGRALDRLEAKGLLSDERYALAWMRQRSRRHAEGPTSLEAHLSAKGIRRDCIRRALSAMLDGGDRHAYALAAWELVARKKGDRREAERAFLSLGWKRADLIALDRLHGEGEGSAPPG